MAKFHSLTVKDIRRETAECVSIAFEVPPALQEDYRFTPGQNLTLRTVIDAEDIRRSYSICTSPSDNELRIAIKKIPHGKFSAFSDQIKKGMKLDVMTPTGSFHARHSSTDKPKHYVAFAAGSGITPVFSILKAVLESEPNSRFTLFYGNKSTASIIFKENIEALKNQYLSRLSVYHILSRERSDAFIFNGRINAEKCAVFFEKLIDLEDVDDFLLCGPEGMIMDVKAFLSKKGVSPKKIHFELFTTPATKIAPTVTNGHPKSATAGGQSQVTVKLDGITFDFTMPQEGESILDAALHQGADLPFACKGGVCTTCKARLLEGKVAMDVNYGLEADEVHEGFILTCQSHPVTEKVFVDFD